MGCFVFLNGLEKGFVLILLTKRRALRGAFLCGLLLAGGFVLGPRIPVARAQALPDSGGGQMPKMPGEWVPRVEVRRESGGSVGAVLVNNRVVMRLKPASRADTVAERLRFGVGAGLGADSVRVDAALTPDFPSLILGGFPVLAASASEQKVGTKKKGAAERARAGALSEAQEWARNLKAALKLPGLTASDNGKIVPLGESRTVKLGGAARGQIALLDAAQSVQVLVNDQTGVVTFTGKRVGRETLTLVREGATVKVTIAVEPYAAALSPAAPVTVTAPGIEPVITRNLARDAALRALSLTPGATVSLGEPRAEAGHKAYRVPVVVTGADMLPVRETVRVPVETVRLPPFQAANLFYSNDPERVTQPGLLFASRLDAAGANGGATRLLYHHQNMGQNLWFSAELVNESDAICRVLVLGGDAGPERDTVWVGYQAGRAFVRDFADKRGVVVPVPPHSRVALQTARLPHGTTISGLMQLRVLSGPAPLVRIAALSYDDPRRLSEAFVAAPWTGNAEEAKLSPHVYLDPVQTLAARYEVGGRWAFVAIGRKPLTAALFPTKELQGNYGVSYNVAFTLENPTDAPAPARIVFEPSAGLAGGVFEVSGGQTVTIPQTNMPKETEIAAFMLAPGETKTVTVRTIPLSGSNYPATLIARP